MIRRPPRSTLDRSSAASDVYKRQGREKDPAALALLGQLVADTEILRACLHAAEVDVVRTKTGYYAARMSSAYRLHGIEASDRAERILEDLLTSSLVLTGGASD